MTALAPAALPSLRVPTESLRCGLLWLTGLSAAFVLVEPSPYEVVSLLTIVAFAATGLSLHRAVAPLVLLLILYVTGYGIAVVQVSDQPKAVTWVFISIFLAMTAVFYAGMLGTNTQVRIAWLMRGYLAAAMISSLIAIGAYFHLFGGLSDLFTLYDRARGTFNDPNVLGAFLVLPGLMVFQRILAGRLSSVIGNGFTLLVMLAALFLTFSRGAWFQFAFSALLLMGMTLMTSGSTRERSRIVLIGLLGVLAIAILIGALLSFGQVADLFQQRATLEQSYDVGHFGRFGRYSLGAELALDQPFGIGPLQFSQLFSEDPHNTYLNTFMSGGWLTGVSYLTITALTLVLGLRFIVTPTPWRPAYQVFYAAYVGMVGESAIIDSDHWRHYFIVLGVLWGLMAASRSYTTARGSSALAPLRQGV